MKMKTLFLVTALAVLGGCASTSSTTTDRLDALENQLAGVQVAGGCVGTILANVMFIEQTGRGAIFLSERERNTAAELVAEVIATIGLLLVIHGASRSDRPHVVAVAVGVWIGGAYFFTSSTSFANPMVSIARTLSDTFAGIEPASAPGFIGAQLVGALIAWPLVRYLFVEPVARHT